jgi:hypothetical protein
MTASNSTGRIGGPASWLVENFQFFLMRVKGISNQRAQMNAVISEIEEYAQLYRDATGRDLRHACILEIGYGARPLRLMALQSLGYNAKGIDLDRPALGTIRDFVEIYRCNGSRRLIKSVVRHLLFDRYERRALDAALRLRGSRLRIDRNGFLVGDVANYPFDDESIDFVFSEDVFEHIPPSGIDQLCRRLRQALAPEGLALITPAIYSGISGGHLVEWYPHTLPQERRRSTEPWEHLRKRRVVPDCYLNELRINDYTAMFSAHFCLMQIIDRDKGIGREFLTEEIRAELSSFNLDELLCNRVTFVLKGRNALRGAEA